MEVRTQLANLGPVFVQETVESGQMVMVDGVLCCGSSARGDVFTETGKIGDGSFGDGSASTGGCFT